MIGTGRTLSALGPHRIHWRTLVWCEPSGEYRGQLGPYHRQPGQLPFESIVEWAHAMNDRDDGLISFLVERAVCPAAIDWAGYCEACDSFGYDYTKEGKRVPCTVCR